MADVYKGIGRNDPCPCGSGKKFKKCCLHSRNLNEPSSELRGIDQREPETARAAPEQEKEAAWRYDPLVEPDPDRWLALDEQERIDIVMEYHRRAGIRFPRAKLHAIFHTIVESQIADAELPVRRTLQRLMSEGLDRHEAIHAIGSVLAGHMNDIMSGIRSGGDGNQDPNVVYFAELESLTAEKWLRSA